MTTETTVDASPKQRLGANYNRLFAASLISNIGDGISFVAYPWLVALITRDAILVALVAAAQQLPWLIFSLPAGVITDRVDRKRLMTGCWCIAGYGSP